MSERCRSILIVEDERIVATDLQQMLKELQYDAFDIASSAEQAIDLASKRCPDLVLMDVRIDGPLDGIQAAELLRRRFRTGIVYLTAHADEGMLQRAKKTEPQGYLLKPVSSLDLRRVLEIALYRLEMERSLEKALQLEAEKKVLQETARMKDAFLANMSHVLRTPLNGIIGFAELMRNGMVGPLSEAHKDYLGEVLTCGRGFLRLITDILDLANIEAGRLELRPERLDLHRLTDYVLDSVRPALEEKGQRVTVNIDTRCATVGADATTLKQILYNLVSNAIVLGCVAGNIGVDATVDEPGRFRIEVSDPGSGISDADANRLFTLFERWDAGVPRHFEEAGVSLVLARRLAEVQRGLVGFRRAADGRSVFFADMPQAALI